MARSLVLAALAGAALLLPSPGAALSTTISATKEECYYEDVTANEELQGSFEVMSGGFFDIDVTVRASAAADELAAA